MTTEFTGGCLCGAVTYKAKGAPKLGGCPVYSTNSGMPGMVFLRASSLDDPEVFISNLIVYASRAASWDVMDPSLPSFAEMPEQVPEDM